MEFWFQQWRPRIGLGAHKQDKTGVRRILHTADRRSGTGVRALLFHNYLVFSNADTDYNLKHRAARGERLSRMGDALPTERRIARDIEMNLARRVPPGWTICSDPAVLSDQLGGDLLIKVTSPAGETALLAVEIKSRVEPRRVPELAHRVRAVTTADLSGAIPVLGAAYLSPRAREMLREFDVGYIDTTGNVWITSSAPGMFISADGNEKDPWPRRDVLQSLRGRGAACAVRSIVDVAPPFGVRELAEATGTPAPTLSRVLRLLEREGVVNRQSRGRVVAVDWQGAIRRWAQDYDQAGSNTATALLEPRGLAAFTSKLRASTFTYAATGAFAAQHFDPIAPARAAALYVTDAVEAAESLGLRKTSAGANVMLVEPFDPVVFERTIERDGLRCVAASQLAVDLLTGPGREPSQGEEMLTWMEQNEDAWRT